MTGTRAERALDALNLFLSDVRYGLGAYLAVYRRPACSSRSRRASGR